MLRIWLVGSSTVSEIPEEIQTGIASRNTGCTRQFNKIEASVSEVLLGEVRHNCTLSGTIACIAYIYAVAESSIAIDQAICNA